MNLKSPKIGIDDTVFVADRHTQTLHQWSQPDNRIRLDALKKNNEGRWILYDARTGNLAKDGNKEVSSLGFLTKIFIPDRLFEWKEHPDQAAIDRFNTDARQQDWNMMMPSADLNLRLMGVLPTVSFGEDTFIFDWRAWQLRYAGGPRYISLDDLDYSPETGYYFFYDQKNKRLYHIDSGLTELPENVVLVQLPDEYTLDSFAVCREDGFNELQFEQDHPYRAQHAATIIPLSQTSLPLMVAENRERQQAQRQATKEQIGEGTYVLVNPEIPLDPFLRQGYVGKVLRLDPGQDTVHLEFQTGLPGVFSPKELLLLKPADELWNTFLNSKQLPEFHQLLMVDVYKCVLSGTPEDLSKAYTLLQGNTLVRERMTVSFHDLLNQERDNNRDEGIDPGRGR